MYEDEVAKGYWCPSCEMFENDYDIDDAEPDREECPACGCLKAEHQVAKVMATVTS